MNIVERSVEACKSHFGAGPQFAAVAPGRVELMGNHTDYNGGYVLPAALDKATAVVGTPSNDGKIRLYALDLDKSAEFDAANIVRDPSNTWADYVLGVVDQLRKAGVEIGGFSAVIHSDVPTGAGLSSSAALEVSTAFFLRELFPFNLEPMEIARLCQRAENQYVGVNSGILDQFSSIFGKKDSLLFLDCLTLEHDTVKMGRDDIAIVICDSRVKHALTGGDYNTRRAECMAAAAHFGKDLLREVDWDEFVARENELPIEQRKRARHILTENKRVLAMREAVAKADVDALSRLLAEAHASNRDLFENSTEELDYLVEAADKIEGCIGGKLTGGGWGGCTVNLVYENAVDSFCKELRAAYKAKFGVDAAIYPCKASEGARVVAI
jgi:galactokinase